MEFVCEHVAYIVTNKWDNVPVYNKYIKWNLYVKILPTMWPINEINDTCLSCLDDIAYTTDS